MQESRIGPGTAMVGLIAVLAASPPARTQPAENAPVRVGLELSPEKARHASRVRDEAAGSWALLAEWFGPVEADEVTLVDAPPAPVGDTGRSPTVRVPVPWWAPSGDRLLERRVIAGVARAYWTAAAGSMDGDRGTLEGVAAFTAARLTHTRLEGSHFHAPRLFGGFLSFPARFLPLTSELNDTRPYLRDFDAFVPPAAVRARTPVGVEDFHARRVALLLHSLERYLGWPSLQQALAALVANGRALSRGLLLEAIEGATGRDLSWLFDAALDASRQFDYGIEAVRTAAQGDTYRTTVVVRRFGSATFPGTGRPPLGRFESGRGVVVEILFADGAVRESWDGRDAQREFMFESRTPPAAAFVDPDLVLLLDENRFNNGWRRHPGEMAVPLRWSLQWMAMLQDFMLLIPAL